MERHILLGFKKYSRWDLSKDIIVTDRPPMFSLEKAKQHEQFPFCVANTEKGVFYQKAKGDAYNIVLANSLGSKVVMKDAFVVSSNLQYSCLIIRNNSLAKCYIVDTRGIFFELPDTKNGQFFGPMQYGFAFDKKTGCCKIQDYSGVVLWAIKAESDEATEAYKKETKPDLTLTINPKFKKFVAQKKLGKQRYLCFTCDSSKQGQIVKWLMTKGLPYTLMPNVFVDDDTVNIMVEVNMESSAREDVLYLLSKYKSGYSIFNIPINHYLSAMNSYKARHEFKLNLPTLKEPQLKMCDTVLNTMRVKLGLTSDELICEKVFKPILSLFYIGVNYNSNKEFGYAFIPMDNEGFDSIPNPFANKEELQKYESSLLARMKEDGVKISKWKNEVDLFLLIYQSYPDTIYQYHAPWLGSQSLDVYIPSLKLGFEYQGIQHFEPVDRFGGAEGFKSIQERDQRKKKLCEENGVQVIYWNYDEPVNDLVLQKKLEQNRNVENIE